MSVNSASQQLRRLLANRTQSILRTPCCHDALSARLIQREGFSAAFVSGFAVAAASKALPDAGLVSFEESRQVVTSIIDAVSNSNELYGAADNKYFPVIVDADTGYGNEMNVRRTIASFARLGAAGIMIEDQQQPKRCGHAKGKSVIPFDRAVSRIKAACDARNELGGGKDSGIVIIARTDARAEHGLEEALRRARAFREAGADVTFVEAPRSMEELELVGRDAGSGPYKMANMLLHGHTPNLESKKLQEMGFALAAYPFDLMVSSISAMTSTLRSLKANDGDRDYAKSQVDELWDVAGFNRYYEMEKRYS